LPLIAIVAQCSVGMAIIAMCGPTIANCR